MSEYQISLARVEKELGLKTLYSPAELDTLFVKSREVNRPGLELNGYLEYFEASRIIVFGNQEVSFLNSLPDEKKREALGYILPAHPPAVIFARSLQPSDLFMEMARQHQVPVFLTDDTTSSVVSALVSLLLSLIHIFVISHVFSLLGYFVPGFCGGLESRHRTIPFFVGEKH